MQLFAHEGITAGIRRAFVITSPATTGPSMKCCSLPCGTSGRNTSVIPGMTAEPVELPQLLGIANEWCRNCKADWMRTNRFCRSSPVFRNWPLESHMLSNCREFAGNCTTWQLQRKSPRKFAEQADNLAQRLGRAHRLSMNKEKKAASAMPSTPPFAFITD